MSVLQAAILAAFCYLSGEGIPWLIGDFMGIHAFAKPLVAGLVCGIVLGDIQLGVTLGAAIQTIYISNQIIGGVTSADLVSVSYIALPLAMVSGGTTEIAIAMSVAMGLIGTAIFNFIQVFNITWIQFIDKKAYVADYKGVLFYHVGMTQLFVFIFRFVPAFIMLYFGAEVLPTFAALAPDWLMSALGVMGGILPAVGISILATILIDKTYHWAFLLLGFVMVTYLHLDMIAITCFALIVTVYQYVNDKSSGTTKEDVEDVL